MQKKKYLLYTRRLCQVLFMGLIIFIIWKTRYPLENYINIKYFFYADPFVMLITAIAERVLLFGLVTTLAVLILTFIFGRFFCGWICPLGATMDFFNMVQNSILKKIVRKKSKENEPGATVLIKYGILSLAFILALFGFQVAWFLDPITIFVRTFSFNIHPAINSGIDKLFISLLEGSNFNPTIETVYNALKENILHVSIPRFPHTWLIFLVCILIILLALVKRRFWCRYLCPLGATLALPARYSLLRRSARCKSNCHLCQNNCRMNAIKKDNSYKPEECVLCLDCIYVCPEQVTTFSFNKPVIAAKKSQKDKEIAPFQNNSATNGISRKEFISLVTGSLLLPALTPLYALRDKEPILRPPGALAEKDFIHRCIRCGNCLKVCPTNVLQPAILESSISGMWTPRLNMKIGYCEYTCNLCGSVCPTEAIRSMPVKEKTRYKIGLAHIQKNICIPWAKDDKCIVCEEHCPVPTKAIKLEKYRTPSGEIIQRPIIDKKLCIGCGICEHKCPVQGEKGVVIKNNA